MVEYLAKEFVGQFEDAHDRAIQPLTSKQKQDPGNQNLGFLIGKKRAMYGTDVSSVAMRVLGKRRGPQRPGNGFPQQKQAKVREQCWT